MTRWRGTPSPAAGPQVQHLAPSPRHLLLIILPVLLATGFSVAQAWHEARPTQRLVVGYTAGTLATLIEVDGVRIVVGGGESRSDLAEFVDRSTLPFPWSRRVDLLVVPGWDDRHVVGALGLVERGGVSGIVVVGIPGANPGWTFLEREAQRTGASVRFVQGFQRLRLSELVWINFTTVTPRAAVDARGAVVTLRYHDAQVQVLDLPSLADGRSPVSLDSLDAHLVVSVRPGAAPLPARVALLVRPGPRRSTDLDTPAARFVAEISRGERLGVRMTPHEFRVSADQIRSVETARPDP